MVPLVTLRHIITKLNYSRNYNKDVTYSFVDAKLLNYEYIQNIISEQNAASNFDFTR